MKKLFLFAFAALTLASCSSTNMTMREPAAMMEWERSDFEYSDQLTASAQSTRIAGIDFSRLFGTKTANISKDDLAPNITNNIRMFAGGIPVIGNVVSDNTANLALYKLMEENPGYDVVFYPQFSTKVERPIALGIYTVTTVEVTGRLAKIKK